MQFDVYTGKTYPHPVREQDRQAYEKMSDIVHDLNDSFLKSKEAEAHPAFSSYYRFINQVIDETRQGKDTARDILHVPMSRHFFEYPDMRQSPAFGPDKNKNFTFDEFEKLGL